MSRLHAVGLLLLAVSPAQSQLIYPNGVALDGQGVLYISDIGAHRVLKLADDGRLTVVAGAGSPGFSGDGGPATKAQLNGPQDLAFDTDGNLLIADSLNQRIRRIDRNGQISTFAGTGAAGYSGDGGPATAAKLNGPQAVTLDREGAILIADTYNHVVRRIDRAGLIKTFAGTEPGLSGDGGPATAARISLPTDIAVMADGVVYVSEVGNSRVRRMALDGVIQTIAGFGGGSGLGGAGFSGDGGPAEKGKLFSPGGLDRDAAGNLYISDSGNSRIRVIRGGVISTVAGSGSGEGGFGGDGGKATAALLNTPAKIVVAPDGRLFIADRGNGRVRMVDSSGVIRTIAGEGKPKGITLSSAGNP